jgi:hypothetical protein
MEAGGSEKGFSGDWYDAISAGALYRHRQKTKPAAVRLCRAGRDLPLRHAKGDCGYTIRHSEDIPPDWVIYRGDLDNAAASGVRQRVEQPITPYPAAV